MAEDRPERDPLPEQFATLREAAAFWDTHDLTDYWDLTEEAQFEFELKGRTYLFALAPELAESLAERAAQQGLSAETLINLWLSEKLRDQAA
jgi:predicted DNA binding CopG/RHH family protein